MVERCTWAKQEGEIHLEFYRMSCIQGNWKSTVQFWSVALEIEIDYLLFLQSKKKVFAMDFCVRPCTLRSFAIYLSLRHGNVERNKSRGISRDRYLMKLFLRKVLTLKL